MITIKTNYVGKHLEQAVVADFGIFNGDKFNL